MEENVLNNAYESLEKMKKKSAMMKWIMALLVAGMVIEAIVIFVSTVHVGYFFTTFELAKYKYIGWWTAGLFEFAVVIVFIGTLIDEKYENKSTWNWAIIWSVVFINFLGNMSYSIMLYPYLKGVDGYDMDNFKQVPITTKVVKDIWETDAMYIILSFFVMGVLPLMSLAMLQRTKQTFKSYKKADEENTSKIKEEEEKIQTELKRVKQREANQKWRKNKKETPSERINVEEYLNKNKSKTKK